MISTSALRKRSAKPVAVTALATVAALFVYAAVPSITKPLVWETGAWGTMLLFAFLGYGELVCRLLAPGRKVGLGLRAVWGASALALVTIILANFRLARTSVLVALVALGVVGFGYGTWKRREAIVRRVTASLLLARAKPATAAIVLGATIVVAIYVAGGLGDIYTNPYDDELSYLALPRQLLARGTMVDPFSFRRASALGSQSIFQGLLLANGSLQHLNFFDRGIAAIMLALLIVEFGRGRERPPLLVTVLALLLAFVFFQTRRVNLASNVSGLTFFLGLFSTIRFFSRETNPSAYRRGLVAGALVTATTCALRQSFLPAAVGMFMLPVVAPIVTRRRDVRRKEVLVDAAVAALALGAVLLPWLTLYRETTGAILYPLQKGYLRAGYAVKSTTVVGLKELRHFIGVLMEPERSRYTLLFFVLGLGVPEADARRPLKSFIAAAFLALLLLTDSFSITHVGDIARYGFGYTAAASIVVLLSAGAWLRAEAVQTKLAGAIAVMLAVLQFEPYYAVQRLGDALSFFDEARRRAPQSPRTAPAATYQYVELQAAVPPGEKLIVMVDEPCLLDFGRNEIYSLDLPGALSPPPGIPFFRGPEAFADYFVRTQNARYLAFVDPSSSRYLYRRDIWHARLFDDEAIWRTYAPYFLDAFDNLEALKDSRRVLFEGHGMYVIDLATKASDADRIEHLLSLSKKPKVRPAFGIAVNPAETSPDEATRMAATGFDLATLLVSASPEGIQDRDRVDAFVRAVAQTPMRVAFQIRLGGLTPQASLASAVSELESRGLMDRAFEIDGKKLLFAEPETDAPPLPRYELSGYEIVGVTRWQRFDEFDLDALPEADSLPKGNALDRGLAYLERSGYLPQLAPAWALRGARGVVSITPGWKLSRVTKTSGLVEHDRRGGRTLVEQVDAALSLRPKVVILYAWSDDGSGVGIRPATEGGTFYVDLVARLVGRSGQ